MAILVTHTVRVAAYATWVTFPAWAATARRR